MKCLPIAKKQYTSDGHLLAIRWLSDSYTIRLLSDGNFTCKLAAIRWLSDGYSMSIRWQFMQISLRMVSAIGWPSDGYPMVPSAGYRLVYHLLAIGWYTIRWLSDGNFTCKLVAIRWLSNGYPMAIRWQFMQISLQLQVVSRWQFGLLMVVFAVLLRDSGTDIDGHHEAFSAKFSILKILHSALIRWPV